jgi:hypothetical protein
MEVGRLLMGGRLAVKRKSMTFPSFSPFLPNALLWMA